MQSLLLSVGVGFITAVALLLNGSGLLKLMGLTGTAGAQLLPESLNYLTTRALASPAFLAIMAMEGIFRGHGDTRAPLAAALVAAATNLVLDPLLMFGPLYLGLKGAAAATAVAQYAACATYIWMLRRRRKQIAIATPNFSEWRSYLPVARRILAANGALLLRTFGLMLCWATGTSVVTKVGAAHGAAHQVTLSIFLPFALLAEAPSVAGQVLTARYTTARNFERARRVGIKLLVGSVGFGLVGSVVRT